MNIVDLHVHSNKSDGSFTPAQLVEYASQKGLSAFALTDHDTTEGIDEAIAAAAALPEDRRVKVIPGIEFSTQYGTKDIHIVGLYIDYKSEVFANQIKAFVDARIERNRNMCAKLQTAGLDITYEKLTSAFPDAVITRGHYAKYMLDRGFIKSLPEAFERYVGDHCPYFVPREKVTPAQAVTLILKAGGIPILAHPTLYHMGPANLDTLVKGLKKDGLIGIEAIYSTHTPAEERKIRKLAAKYDLTVSGGSDFHGSNKPGLDLATGYGSLVIPESVLTDLESMLPTAPPTRILFTDLDGTLLDSQKKISGYTRDILRDWTQSGNLLVLSSGRAIASILDVKEELLLSFPNMYLIGYNGGEIYDCEQGQSLHRTALTMEQTTIIMKTASSMGIYCHTYTDTHIVSPSDGPELHYYKRAIHSPVIFCRDVVSALDQPPCKCIAIELSDPDRLEHFRKTVSKLLGDEVATLYSNPKYLELFPACSGKGSAVSKLCELASVSPQNALAFGDEENDISMLLAVDLGIAMKNARDKVKEAAGLVTEYDNNNDGLARALAAL